MEEMSINNKAKKPCKIFFQTGICKFNNNCHFSHEQQSQVTQAISTIKSSQQMCKNDLKGKCKYGQNCRFSHEQQSQVNQEISIIKTSQQMCKNDMKGNCKYGQNCRFTHRSQLLLQPLDQFNIPNLLVQSFQQITNQSKDHVLKKPNSQVITNKNIGSKLDYEYLKELEKNDQSATILKKIQEQLNIKLQLKNSKVTKYFPKSNKTKIIWSFFNCQSQFQEYSPQQTMDIEKAYTQQQQKIVSVQTTEFTYSLDLINMLQTNTKTQKVRQIKRQEMNENVQKQYQWQYQQNNNNQFADFTAQKSAEIERNYFIFLQKKLYKDKFTLKINNDQSSQIDFWTFTQQNNKQKIKIRRVDQQQDLQTLSNQQVVNAEQITKENINLFISCNSKEIMNQTIELIKNKLNKLKTTVQIQIPKQISDYILNRLQTTIKKHGLLQSTQQQEKIQKGNGYVIQGFKYQVDKVMSLINSSQNSNKLNTNGISFSRTIDNLQLNQDWTKQKELFQKVELAETDSEYKQVKALFEKTMLNNKIISINRLQNKILWKNYQNEKNKMISDKKQYHNKNIQSNERFLWHGTSQSDPELIYNDNSGEGFDINYCSDNCMWGKGSYFAENASYSNSYAYMKQQNGLFSTFNGTNQKQFLLCLVALGDCIHIPSDSTLKLPPSINKDDPKQGRYDSVQGNTGGSNVFILYSMNVRRSYPYFEITYE